MTEPSSNAGPWWKKLAWLFLIWALSVAFLAIVAYLLRCFMQLAGLAAG